MTGVFFFLKPAAFCWIDSGTLGLTTHPAPVKSKGVRKGPTPNNYQPPLHLFFVPSSPTFPPFLRPTFLLHVFLFLYPSAFFLPPSLPNSVLSPPLSPNPLSHILLLFFLLFLLILVIIFLV